MNTQYYIDLNNEYEFYYYCSKTSLEAFKNARRTRTFPSRSSCLTLLATEILAAPVYLANKSLEVTFHVFHILSTQKTSVRDMKAKDLFNLGTVGLFQFMTPWVCTTIRIWAAAMVLFSPSLTLKGWELAESGESFIYLLWSIIFKNSNCRSNKKEIFEEIVPSTAIFYLGETVTRLLLEKEATDYENLDTEILAIFSNLLRTIADDNFDCLYKLLDYSKAINPKIRISKHQCYHLSHDVKKILMQFKPGAIENRENLDDHLDSDDDLILDDILDTIHQQLSIEQSQKLFSHIYFNLRSAFLKDDLNLNQIVIESQFTQLKDLFSQRLRFGRAHFAHSLSGWHIGGSD